MKEENINIAENYDNEHKIEDNQSLYIVICKDE